MPSRHARTPEAAAAGALGLPAVGAAFGTPSTEEALRARLEFRSAGCLHRRQPCCVRAAARKRRSCSPRGELGRGRSSNTTPARPFRYSRETSRLMRKGASDRVGPRRSARRRDRRQQRAPPARARARAHRNGRVDVRARVQRAPRRRASAARSSAVALREHARARTRAPASASTRAQVDLAARRGAARRARRDGPSATPRCTAASSASARRRRRRRVPEPGCAPVEPGSAADAVSANASARTGSRAAAARTGRARAPRGSGRGSGASRRSARERERARDRVRPPPPRRRAPPVRRVHDLAPPWSRKRAHLGPAARRLGTSTPTLNAPPRNAGARPRAAGR